MQYLYAVVVLIIILYLNRILLQKGGEIMDKLVSWFTENWTTVVLIALALNTFLKGIRDAVDTTPDVDNTPFERFVTIFGKVVAYLFKGERSY